MDINVDNYNKELEKYMLKKGYIKEDLKIYNQMRDDDLLKHMQMYIMSNYSNNNFKEFSTVKNLNRKLFNNYLSKYR